MGLFRVLAEKEGFEPPVPCGTPVFKTGAFDHSAISPWQRYAYFKDWQWINLIFFKKKFNYFVSR